MYLLKLALYYADREKGILWLAEKFFQAAIAVSSQYLIDGGRLKGCCKYQFAKFLLDKCEYFEQVKINSVDSNFTPTLRYAC